MDFSLIEEDYTSNAKNLSRHISRLNQPNLGKDRTKQILREAQNSLNICNSNINEMKDHIRCLTSASPNIRSYKAKLQQYKNDFVKMKQDVQRGKEQYQHKQLVNSKKKNNTRNNILNAEESLDRTDRSLEDSKRLMEESNEIGIATRTKMEQQRESLLNTRNMVSFLFFFSFLICFFVCFF
eukprot:TRINITY_DN284068_c0_g1_i1.p1 TRINITY_DN284068_c0_g1~~TRINITY_DN284068_c0_g1_i1.p1  ORF type:complete len:198 (+),score=29.06 TRINITY_DN284068_c0_g1_i1:49-594(+)